MNRFELLTTLKDTLNDNLIVCNIGLPSQELYKIQDMPNYFYMLGVKMGLICNYKAIFPLINLI